MFDVLRRLCFQSSFNFPVSSFKANCHQVVKKIVSPLVGIVSKHQLSLNFIEFMYSGRGDKGMV